MRRDDQHILAYGVLGTGGALLVPTLGVLVSAWLALWTWLGLVAMLALLLNRAGGKPHTRPTTHP